MMVKTIVMSPQLQPARQGWQNTDAYATYAIPLQTGTIL